MNMHDDYSFSKIELHQEKMPSFDGTKLHCSYVMQPHEASLIFFVHGYSNHTGLFEDTITWLFNQGIHVGIFDVRGHGKSEGRRGYVDDYSTYAKDMDIVLSNQVNACKPISTFVITLSTGGLIASYYLLSSYSNVKINSMVMCCPYFGMPAQMQPNSLKKMISKCVNFFYPYAHVPKPILVDKITHSKKWREYFKNDPYRFSKTSVSWFFACESAMKFVFSNINQWPKSVSMFMITSGIDVVVDTEESKKLYDKMISINKKYHNYDNMCHQILNDENSEEVYQEIGSWLKDK